MAGQPLRAVVAGAGIGGLVAALSLHEIGMAVDVYESVRAVRPLGVGINLLPHAARELDALGLLPELRSRAVEPESLVYCSRHGRGSGGNPAAAPPGTSGRRCPSTAGSCRSSSSGPSSSGLGPITSTSGIGSCASTQGGDLRRRQCRDG